MLMLTWDPWVYVLVIAIVIPLSLWWDHRKKARRARGAVLFPPVAGTPPRKRTSPLAIILFIAALFGIFWLADRINHPQPKELPPPFPSQAPRGSPGR